MLRTPVGGIISPDRTDSMPALNSDVVNIERMLLMKLYFKSRSDAIYQ